MHEIQFGRVFVGNTPRDGHPTPSKNGCRTFVYETEVGSKVSGIESVVGLTLEGSRGLGVVGLIRGGSKD